MDKPQDFLSRFNQSGPGLRWPDAQNIVALPSLFWAWFIAWRIKQKPTH